MEQFLQQIEVLNYKIENADDNFVIGSIPMFMDGCPNSYINCSISGFDGIANHIPMYIGCGELFTGSLDLSIASIPETGSIDFFMYSLADSGIFSSIPLYITTESDTVFGEEAEITLFLAAPESAILENSIPLYVENGENQPSKVLDLFLLNDFLEYARSLKLHIAGEGLYDGYIPYGDGVTLHLERLPAETLNMFIQAVEGEMTSDLNFSMISTISAEDDIAFSLPNSSSEEEIGVEMFVSGF